MTLVRQPGFVGGEVAKELHARTDLELYRHALRLARNFCPTADGGLVNRPGTVYQASTKDSSKVSRLIPFIFGDGQNYVLEFGDLYFRVFYGGVYLAVEEVTTYAEADLAGLSYTQSGDILTITSLSYPPREVTRTGHTTWAIADKSFAAVQAAPTGGSRTLDAATTPKKPWEVWVTAVDANGNESTALKVVTQPTHGDFCAEAGNTSSGEGTKNVYGWTAPAGTAPTLYRVFRGQNGVPGYIGSTFTTSFRDDGQAPDFNDRPPTYPNPFGSAGNYPRACVYHDQRLWFAGTTNKPNGLWGSVVGLFRLFESHQPPLEDDAVVLALANRVKETIRHLGSGKALLAFTDSVVHPVSGAGSDEPISATSVQAPPNPKVGISEVAPLEADHSFLLVEDGGSRVHELAFDAAVGGYSARSLTVFGHHLVDGHTIVDWCFARKPFAVVWAVRDDGVLLSLTYERAQGVFAWARHDTDQAETNPATGYKQHGAVESVCTVPEGDEDAVYLIVNRTFGISPATPHRYIERLSTRKVEDARLGVFVDAAFVYDGRNTSAAKVTLEEIDSGGWGVGAELRATADTLDSFPAATWMVGDLLVINPDADPSAVFGSATGNTTVVQLEVTNVLSGTELTATVVNVEVPAAYRNAGSSAWGWARANFTTGLDHLNGRYVRWLSDGIPSTGDVDAWQVTGNELLISRAGCVVVIGLPITQQLDTLDFYAGDGARAGNKVVTRLGFDLLTSRDAYQVQVGQRLTGDLVNQPPTRDFATAPGDTPLEQVTAEVPIMSKQEFAGGGRAVLQHVDPLPLAVLSFWRDVEPGGTP